MIFGLGWVLNASLSVRCGDAAGPFRPYGGSLLSWQKEPKPLAPASGPTLRSGSPRYGAFQGHRGLRLASPSLRLANFGFGRRVLRTSPLQTPTLGLLKSRSYGRRLYGRIFEIRLWRSQADAIAGQARSHRVNWSPGGSGLAPRYRPASYIASREIPLQSLALHARKFRRRGLRLQEAERRYL